MEPPTAATTDFVESAIRNHDSAITAEGAEEFALSLDDRFSIRRVSSCSVFSASPCETIVPTEILFEATPQNCPAHSCDGGADRSDINVDSPCSSSPLRIQKKLNILSWPWSPTLGRVIRQNHRTALWLSAVDSISRSSSLQGTLESRGHSDPHPLLLQPPNAPGSTTPLRSDQEELVIPPPLDVQPSSTAPCSLTLPSCRVTLAACLRHLPGNKKEPPALRCAEWLMLAILLTASVGLLCGFAIFRTLVALTEPYSTSAASSSTWCQLGIVFRIQLSALAASLLSQTLVAYWRPFIFLRGRLRSAEEILPPNFTIRLVGIMVSTIGLVMGRFNAFILPVQIGAFNYRAPFIILGCIVAVPFFDALSTTLVAAANNQRCSEDVYLPQPKAWYSRSSCGAVSEFMSVLDAEEFAHIKMTERCAGCRRYSPDCSVLLYHCGLAGCLQFLLKVSSTLNQGADMVTAKMQQFLFPSTAILTTPFLDELLQTSAAANSATMNLISESDQTDISSHEGVNDLRDVKMLNKTLRQETHYYCIIALCLACALTVALYSGEHILKQNWRLLLPLRVPPGTWYKAWPPYVAGTLVGCSQILMRALWWGGIRPTVPTMKLLFMCFISRFPTFPHSSAFPLQPQQTGSIQSLPLMHLGQWFYLGGLVLGGFVGAISLGLLGGSLLPPIGAVPVGPLLVIRSSVAAFVAGLLFALGNLISSEDDLSIVFGMADLRVSAYTAAVVFAVTATSVVPLS